MRQEAQHLKSSDLALKSILSFSLDSEPLSKREMLVFREYSNSVGSLAEYFNQLALNCETLRKGITQDSESVARLKDDLIETYFRLLSRDRIEFFPCYQQLVLNKHSEQGVYVTNTSMLLLTQLF